MDTAEPVVPLDPIDPVGWILNLSRVQQTLPYFTLTD